jgi:hypothetical protein
MKKSELLMKKIQKAQYLLEQVDAIQQELFSEFETEGAAESPQCFDIHCEIEGLIATFDDVAYEFVSPIQMDEEMEEKKLELIALKARVAELENELCYGE